MTRQDFLDQMWTTYKARFNAHSRLLFTNKWYTYILSALSIYILSLNVLQLLPVVKSLDQAFVTFYTIVLSIGGAVVGVIFGGSDARLVASRFHDCASEIKALHGQIAVLLDHLTDQQFSEKVTEYNKILQAYDINHHSMDSSKVKYDKLEKEFWSKFGFQLTYFARFYLLLLASLIAPVVFGLMIVFK